MRSGDGSRFHTSLLKLFRSICDAERPVQEIECMVMDFLSSGTRPSGTSHDTRSG